MAGVTSAAGSVELARNSGSSSLKFGLYCVDSGSATALTTGDIETTDGHGDFFDRIDAALLHEAVVRHRMRSATAWSMADRTDALIA